MKEKIGIALAGFFGAIGPSLAEFVSLSKNGKMPDLSFFIGAIIMGIMGLAVVLIAKETVPWKAFTQGIGAPALFSTATTAATSLALMASPIPAVYADTLQPVAFDSIRTQLPDSVILIIDQNLYKKSLPGSTIVIERDDFTTSYVVPDKDTVKLETEIYNPSIRRALIQGLLPMQKNLTEQFQPKLIVREK